MTDQDVQPSDAELTDQVRRLGDKVDKLAKELRAQNAQTRELTRRRTRVIAFWLAASVSILAVAAIFQIRATSDLEDAISANNRKFCPLITPFIPPPGQQGPTTENGRRITAAMTRLAADPAFRCIP